MFKVSKLLMFLVVAMFAYNLDAKTISGLVSDKSNKEPIPGIKVEVLNQKKQSFTQKDGTFKIDINGDDNVELRFTSVLWKSFTMAVNTNSAENLKVELEPTVTNMNEVIVYGASKRLQKITESPSAITKLNEEDIKIASRSNQIGAALNGRPGVDVLLNGTTDFIVNTRGFNNGLNRRLLVLQDGRDMAMPLLGAQEWNSSALPLDEYAKIEFIKGPASALYGANSFNGVMALTSYAPKEVIGTKVSLLAGDYETFRGDIRHAGFITNELTYKVTFGRSSSLNLSKSRTDSSMLEYPGTKLERRPIKEEERNTYSKYGTLRFDYDLDSDKKVVLEGGYSDSGNETFVQPLGRVLVTSTQRPYVRLAYNSENINFQTSYMRRDVQDSMWLLFAFRGPTFPLGSPILTDDEDIMFDLQYNTALNDDKSMNIVIGASQQFQNINTHGTTLKNAINADFTGVYGQFEWDMMKDLKLVLSGRYDQTNLHDAQFSPRAAIVYSLVENHKLRLSASKSFQRPNYSELYRYTPDRAFNGTTNANLKNIDALITDSLRAWTGNSTLDTVRLGLNTVTGLAVGNANLKVEQNSGFELGYQGVFGTDIYFSADIYYNVITDFVTNFGPSYNTNVEKWSSKLSGDAAQFTDEVDAIIYNKLVGDDRTRLSIYEGKNRLIQSVGNFGEVKQKGADLSVNWYMSNEWLLGANYSIYQYEVTKNETGVDISSNTAPNKANVSLQYMDKGNFDVKATVQYMDTYKWIAGASVGQVPSYTILNLSAGYKVSENFELSTYIFNVFNTDIIQIFGGTYLPRQANVKATLSL